MWEYGKWCYSSANYSGFGLSIFLKWGIIDDKQNWIIRTEIISS